jgi:hypothetical protein
MLLMIAEMSLSIVLAHPSLSTHLALHSETAHLLGLAGQLVFALLRVIRTMRRGTPPRG